MKTIVRTNSNTITGYEMAIIDDNGMETIKDVSWCKSKDPRYARMLELPENPANRKWLQEKVILKNNGEVELEYKESKKFGPRDKKEPSKELMDYMSDEDKATIEAIMAKARQAMRQAAIDEQKAIIAEEQAKLAQMMEA